MSFRYDPRIVAIKDGKGYLIERDAAGKVITKPASLDDYAQEFAERFKCMSLVVNTWILNRTKKDYCAVRILYSDNTGKLDDEIRKALNVKGISGDGMLAMLQSAYANYKDDDSGKDETKIFIVPSAAEQPKPAALDDITENALNSGRY